MTDFQYTVSPSASDDFLLETLGAFIKHHRLALNKSQSVLAHEAGISRSTLSELENGKGSNLLTLVQVLRMLGRLDALNGFVVRQEISPILYAEMEARKRQRASKGQDGGSIASEPPSEW